MNVTEIKHKRLAQEIVKCKGDKALAYRKVYPTCKSDNSAKVAVSRLMNSHPSIKEDIASMLNSAGIDVAQCNQWLKSLITADKEYYDNKGRLRIVRDNTTRLGAVKTAYQLHGHLGSGNNTNIDARSVTLNTVDDVQTEQLTQVVADLKAMNEQLEGDADAQTGRVEDVESIRPVEEQ